MMVSHHYGTTTTSSPVQAKCKCNAARILYLVVSNLNVLYYVYLCTQYEALNLHYGLTPLPFFLYSGQGKNGSTISEVISEASAS